MAEFKCKPGECVDCCTYSGLLIPVTLGDLYRSLIYERKIKERRVKLYDVFQELCEGFTVSPIFNAPGRGFVTIKSKIPCRNVDQNGKVCSVYHKAQYVGCGLCPEERLLQEDRRHEANESPATVEFFEGLDCLEGVELTPERAEVIRQRRNLASDEVMMTSQLLAFQRDVGRMRPKAFQREMRRRMRYLSGSAMSRLSQNVRQTMQRYVDLYVDDTDWEDTLLGYFGLK